MSIDVSDDLDEDDDLSDADVSADPVGGTQLSLSLALLSFTWSRADPSFLEVSKGEKRKRQADDEQENGVEGEQDEGNDGPPRKLWTSMMWKKLRMMFILYR